MHILRSDAVPSDLTDVGIRPESIAKTSITTIQAIFTDEKQAKQILSAAKRVTKKRAAGEDALSTTSPAKRTKKDPFSSIEEDPRAFEESLALPECSASEEELRETILHTNRAPLVLAFAVSLLRYTMPNQPLSSRLSLAQAVVSVNSRSKAISLGIEKSKSAEDEGWGEGQPTAKIMGREMRVMKRWGYNWRDGKAKVESESIKGEDADTQETNKHDHNSVIEEPALWGLDLEAARSSKASFISHRGPSDITGLPIYTAQSARAYLVRSFASSPPPANIAENMAKKKPPPALLAKEKEKNLAKLLQAIDLLYSSWARVLSHEELDKRAWSWYVAVRPDVENGVAGWGGKGEVSLKRILELRRKG